MAEEKKLSFKYTANKGETPPPADADSNALYLTDGKLYKGNVLIAEKNPYSKEQIDYGYFPNMRVGLADDLGDIEERVDSEYLFQPTAKDENIRDGYAHIESLKGNSLVWNQKVYNNISVNDPGLSVTKSGNVYTINGTATKVWPPVILTATVPINQNRKYVLIYNHLGGSVVAGGTNTPSIIEGYRSSVGKFSLNSSTANILSVNAVSAGYPAEFGIQGNVGDIYTDLEFSIQIIDLTQMFGESNEPTTIGEYYARKPQVADEYAYNKGEIISFDADAIKSVGYNQWDEEWEVGRYQNGLKSTPKETEIRSKNLIRIIAGAKYYNAYDSKVYISYFDKNGNWLQGSGIDVGYIVGGKTEFTVPSNAYFLGFFVEGTSTYNHDICINISDPAKNGTYEPHRQFTRNLPRRGELRSAGTAHDEIYYNHDIREYVKVTRMGEVDLGDLDWGNRANESKEGVFSASFPQRIISSSFNAVCSIYNNKGNVIGVAVMASAIDKSIYAFYDGSQHATRPIYIYDSSYTDAASFKAAMQGVKLIYELAEPIETILSDVEYMDYYVENGGTEQVLSENNTTPIRTTTVYNFDAVSTIRQNRFDVSELKSGYSSLSAKVSSAETNISNLSSYVSQNATAIDNIVNGTTAAGKANKLATPRIIWGQSFDGSGNVTGAMTGVTTINGGTPITSSNIASQSVNSANTANSVAWSGVTGKPNTLAGYGITDAISTSNIGSQTVAQALELIDSNGNVSYTAEDITTINNKFANYSPKEGSASLTKYSGGTFGNAAAKNYTTSIQSGNTNLVTSGAVFTAIDDLRQEVRVAFPSMATLSAYSLNASTLNCYIESEDNIDLWDDLPAGAVLFVVIQDGASVEGTFNKISAKYDGSSDTTEIAVRQSPGLYSGYGCVLVSTGSLDTSQGGISIVYPVAAS